MKKIGIVLIALSLIIGSIADALPKDLPFEPFIALAFGYFLIGIYLLIIGKEEKKIVAKKESPPPLKKGNCYKDCGHTMNSGGHDPICLNCGSSIVK